MRNKRRIVSFVYMILYILALGLFFFHGGKDGNNWVLFVFAHVYCLCAITINSHEKTDKKIIKSFAVYALLTNILWVTKVSCIWSIVLFSAIGIYHTLILDDNDLFGNLSESGIEDTSLESSKLMIAIALSLFAWVVFFFINGA